MKEKLKIGQTRIVAATNRVALILVLVATVTLLVRIEQFFLASIVISGVELYRWYYGGRGWSKFSLSSPRLIVGFSAAIILGVSTSGVLVLVGALAYAWALYWFSAPSPKLPERLKGLIVAAGSQFFAITAIGLAVTVWHWSNLLVLALVWLVGLSVADRLLLVYEDRSRKLLATAWAMIASESSWIFSVWTVSYVVTLPFLGKMPIILPQLAIVITALGYCFGGIYLAHAGGRLNRARLVEYLMIGLALLVMVIAGTKWNGIV